MAKTENTERPQPAAPPLEERTARESLPKVYDPKLVEEKWYRQWLEYGLFHGNPKTKKPVYSVVIPPPNVTAALHIGHALNHTLQDVLIRWKKLQGFETEWLPGIDHAGIATQVMVEKELAKEGKTRQQLGREAFLEKIRDWKNKYGDTILNQIQKVGCACDWQRTRFTLDEGLSRAVSDVFVRLYEKGLIYRGNYIINWCVRCQTAISDDETERTEINSNLWYLRYPLEDKSGHVVIATTRPETMLGDTAVAVNPDDSRYAHLVGKTAILPLLGRRLPIIADAYVDPEFGTGALKVTPGHDRNDFEIGQRHKLEVVNILNLDGTLNQNAGKFAGQDRLKARAAVVEALETEGLLEKIEPYNLSAVTCSRCHSIIEPLISLQWFVKMQPLAEPAARAVREGQIHFHPEHWAKVYLHWMDTIHDWCISRQLWWGHRIPVWYCRDCGEVNVARTTPAVCRKCQSKNLKQDEDVLDTWFSSWLWPFSTFGWPDETPELKKFYPTKALFTAPEIIFLWVARMVMAGLEFTGKIPFADVYLHGTVRDAIGRAMSKSLGNGIDPLDIIKDHGADALRVSLILAQPDGQDPWISPNTFELGRNFANKLWNATRFALLNLEDFDRSPAEIKDPAMLSLPDRWIFSRLHQTIQTMTAQLDDFRYNAAAKTLYDFAWGDFCDWYLELSKVLLKNAASGAKRKTQAVLFTTLNDLLLLLHPFLPFLSEELWHKLNGIPENDSFRSILQEHWPQANAKLINAGLEKEVAWLQSLITAVRALRGELDIPPVKKSRLVVSVDDLAQKESLEFQLDFVRELARAEAVEVGQHLRRPHQSAVAVLSGAEVYLPLEGLVDIAAEKSRLSRAKEKYEHLLSAVERKLATPEFAQKAPPEVVQKEETKRADFAKAVAKLQALVEQLEK